MIKSILLLISFTIIQLAKADSSWFELKKIYSETVGLDANGDLISGSNWIQGESTAFANGCEDFNDPTGIYYNTRPEMRGAVFWKTNILGNVEYFIDKSNSSCTGIIHPDDYYKRVVWNNLGLIQKDEFGTTTKLCGVGEFCNEIIQLDSSLTRQFATITPTDGTHASFAQRLTAVGYSASSYNVTAPDGIRGLKGERTFTLAPDQIKYCYRIQDASNNDLTSTYYKKPQLELQTIEWNSFALGPLRLDGEVQGVKGRTEVFLGVDSTIRSLLKEATKNGN